MKRTVLTTRLYWMDLGDQEDLP